MDLVRRRAIEPVVTVRVSLDDVESVFAMLSRAVSSSAVPRSSVRPPRDASLHRRNKTGVRSTVVALYARRHGEGRWRERCGDGRPGAPRHGDRLGRADRDGRRPGPARRRVPARRRRAVPGDPRVRPVREGPGVRAGLPGRVARRWSSSTPRSSPGPRTGTKRGRSSIPSGGCPPATRASASTRAGGGARPGPSIRGARARRGISTTASSGRPRSRGATARSASLGISYYAINQWHVAALRPPHLAAMIPWEGFADFYRDMNYHGGIGGDMKDVWYRRTIDDGAARARDRAARRARSRASSSPGPETLSDEELAANRIDFPRRSARTRSTTGGIATARRDSRRSSSRSCRRELGRLVAAPAR